jgi:hypothetical protein
MRLHIFKSVDRFAIEQHRLKREALQSVKERLCKSVNAKRQSDTFPSWMELEAKHV